MTQHATCYHCAELVPEGASYLLSINGSDRQLCCAGCLAVAKTIIDAGLGDYYTTRTQAAKRPELAPSAENLATNALLSSQAVSVKQWYISGITCAACGWLVEHHLLKLSGVLSATVDANNELIIRWRNDITNENALQNRVNQIGYTLYQTQGKETAKRLERKHSLARLGIAGLCTMQVMMFSYPFYGTDNGPDEPAIQWMLKSAALIASLPVIFYSAWPLLFNAFRALMHRQISMEMPIALSITLAFVASVLGLWVSQGPLYLDSVTMFIFFLLSARFIEQRYFHQTLDTTTALKNYLPQHVHRVNTSNIITETAPNDLQPGDIILVHTGETLACEGELLEHAADLDESTLTGENQPHTYQKGDFISSGGINVGPPFTLQILPAYDPKNVDRLRAMLVDAHGQNTIAKTTKAIAQHMMLLVVIGALLCLWVGGYWGIETALSRSIAILAATCPCALSLAAPSISSYITLHMSRLGLYLKNSEAAFRLSQLNNICFDKTGTLTQGQPKLTRIKSLNGQDTSTLLAIAAALEFRQHHPLAKAFSGYGDGRIAEHVSLTAGGGVAGFINQQYYKIGNAKFVGIAAEEETKHEMQPGETDLWLADNKGPLAKFSLRDEPRRELNGLAIALQDQKIQSTILSGDNEPSVAAIAQHFDIKDAIANCTAHSKTEWIYSAQRHAKTVLMIGDGINDSAALNQADIGFAMNTGTDLAKSTADGIITPEGLSSLPAAIRLSKQANAILYQNISWAMIYNVIAIGLAALGQLSPWQAAIGMSLSSLLVIINSLRLRRDSHKPREIHNPLSHSEVTTS